MTQSLLVDRDIKIPMRDGVKLYADIYRPQTSNRLPVLLERTPYGKGFSETSFALFAASQGYAVVIQDTRGRWASEGDSYPFVSEKNDGYDTLEWINQQPWFNGRAGMFGCSYVGYTQYTAAVTRHPTLKTIIPAATFTCPDEIFYPGGAFALGTGLSWSLLAGVQMAILREPIIEAQKAPLWTQWVSAVNGMTSGATFQHLPLEEMTLVGKNGIASSFSDYLQHLPGDLYWQPMDCPYDLIDIPALHFNGWYDLFIGRTLEQFTTLKRRGKAAQKLVVGPWVHCGADGLVGEVDFGIQSYAMMVLPDEIKLRWFDAWLKDQPNGILEEPPIRLFVMGVNQWRDETEWPLARTRITPYYLHSHGGANSLHGDGILSSAPPEIEPADTYLYDPRNPVPTRGGGLCCWNAALSPGAYDQRPVESRPDVLVYTTPPLASDLEVTGPIQVNLWAASSASDTDFTAKLVDVGPCGFARNIQEGIVRARYRKAGEESLLQPGEPYQFTIDVGVTSNVFKAGHCLRLEISSSNFPRYDRNANTGSMPRSQADLKPALQTIFHTDEYPSHILLPVIPGNK